MLGPLTRAGDSPVVPQPSQGRIDVHPFGRENGQFLKAPFPGNLRTSTLSNVWIVWDETIP